MAFRSPGRFGFADDLRRGGGESWDRERLERVGRQIGNRGGFGERPIRSSRFEEPDPYYEEEPRLSRSRRPDFLDEPSQAEIAGRALAPYRRTSIHERDAEIPVRRPPRPKYVRRQSSLDTFDRRPLPRYGDQVYEEEYRPHQYVPRQIPIRSREPNLYNPPRQFREHEYESVHYHHHDHSDSDTHSKISVHQNRNKASRSVKSKTVRSSSSSSSSSSSGVTATTLKSRKKIGKRGKTRIPKRLVKKEVIINFGYPYDEEDDCFVIKRALGKEHIDEVIRISKTYKESVTTYRYDEPKEPVPVIVPEPVPQKTEVEQTTVIKEFEQPALQPAHYHPPMEPVLVEPPPHRHHHVHRDHYYEEPGPLVVAKPHHHHHHGHAHRHDREIQAEIHALEAEKRALKLEREAENKLVMADRVRDGESAYGAVDPKDKDFLRVEKNRKVNPKVAAAMMATLT